MFKYFYYLSMVLLTTPAFASYDAKELLNKVDDLFRSSNSTAKIEMEVTTPDWKRTMEMDVWTKGLDYTFVRINNPRKDRGVSSLKRKTEMWNFFPKINKVIKVPPSMMMGSWMGSDFTNDDLVKDSSLADDYNYKITKETKENITITLTPKKETVSLWGKIVVSLTKNPLLPTQQEFYDEAGEKVRVMHFKDIQTIGGRTLPTTIELIPMVASKKGNKTTIRYKSIDFAARVPSSVFTRTHLQKRR